MLHTPTSQPLFIRRKSAGELLEKQAAAVARMPDDDKRWPAQVLSELHKQLPFLSRFDVDIELTRVEPEAGYAIGYAMLRNKTGKQRAAEELGKATNKIRVPVIVSDRLLQPFHVFEVGGKTYPLTQDKVESAMMNPSMFDGIADPPGTQSLLDQIYPPFQHRQGYGMMSGDRAATAGVSKLSSAPGTDKTANWRHHAFLAGAGAGVGALTGSAAGSAAHPENRKKGALHGAVKGALLGGVALPLSAVAHNHVGAPLAEHAWRKGHQRLADLIELGGEGAGVVAATAPAALAAAYRKKQEKTASGNPGPLREFLQQQELEKQAVLNAGAAATEVKTGIQAVGKLFKPPHIPRVQAPPVAPDVASSLSQVGRGPARTPEQITQLRAARSASQSAPPQPLQQTLAARKAAQPAAATTTSDARPTIKLPQVSPTELPNSVSPSVAPQTPQAPSSGGTASVQATPLKAQLQKMEAAETGTQRSLKPVNRNIPPAEPAAAPTPAVAPAAAPKPAWDAGAPNPDGSKYTGPTGQMKPVTVEGVRYGKDTAGNYFVLRGKGQGHTRVAPPKGVPDVPVVRSPDAGLSEVAARGQPREPTSTNTRTTADLKAEYARKFPASTPAAPAASTPAAPAAKAETETLRRDFNSVAGSTDPISPRPSGPNAVQQIQDNAAARVVTDDPAGINRRNNLSNALDQIKARSATSQTGQGAERLAPAPREGMRPPAQPAQPPTPSPAAAPAQPPTPANPAPETKRPARSNLSDAERMAAEAIAPKPPTPSAPAQPVQPTTPSPARKKSDLSVAKRMEAEALAPKPMTPAERTHAEMEMDAAKFKGSVEEWKGLQSRTTDLNTVRKTKGEDPVTAAQLHAHDQSRAPKPATKVEQPKPMTKAEIHAHDAEIENNGLHWDTSPDQLADLKEARKLIKERTGQDLSLKEVYNRQYTGAPKPAPAESVAPSEAPGQTALEKQQAALQEHHDARGDYQNMSEETARALAKKEGINSDWFSQHWERGNNQSPGAALHDLKSGHLRAQQQNPNLTFNEYMSAQRPIGRHAPTAEAATQSGGGFLGSAPGGLTMLGLGAIGGGMMMANKAKDY